MDKSRHEPTCDRRDLLRWSVASTVAALGSSGMPARGESTPRDRPSSGGALRTPLCERLGIELPIFQAPMGGVALAPLAAAVSEAGGLGVLAGVGLPPEELRRQVRDLRARTSRPFGVNLLLHPAFVEPAHPERVPAPTLERVQRTLDRFRQRFGLAPADAGLTPLPTGLDASIEVLLEERIPVFSIGLGLPTRELVDRFHARGSSVVAMAATVPDAVALAEAGVDAVVAQGSEAGGHRSTWVKGASPDRAGIGGLVLVPQVAEAIDVPVIAAGGIARGSQVAAAFALGAQGAWIGTRFIATRESTAPASYRAAVLHGDGEETRITDVFTGLWARVLRNRFLSEYEEAGTPVLPPLFQYAAARDVLNEAASRDDADHQALYAGQGVGLVRELRSAGEVVANLAEETRAVLDRLSLSLERESAR